MTNYEYKVVEKNDIILESKIYKNPEDELNEMDFNERLLRTIYVSYSELCKKTEKEFLSFLGVSVNALYKFFMEYFKVDDWNILTDYQKLLVVPIVMKDMNKKMKYGAGMQPVYSWTVKKDGSNLEITYTYRFE